MHAARHGVEWCGDASPERQMHAAARNNIVQSVIHQDGLDDAAIFWCDSDVVLPPDGITRLAATGLDFVSGIYFQREGEYWPLIAHFDPEGGEDKNGCFQWVAKWPEYALAEIDGCGFGCVLTSVKMLREMPAPWFAFTKYSEDFDFCLKAKAAGYQLYVDTGVLCGHLRQPEPADYETYKAAHPNLFGGQNGSIRSSTA